MGRRLLVLACALPLLGGCATKRDLRDLREELQASRAQQEALLRELQQQNAAILDSLTAQEIRLRGGLSNQLVQIERQLVQIQELTGQGQQRLAEVREALRAREEALRNVDAGGAAPAAGAGNPDELYGAAQGALERGSLTAARTGFEEFVRQFPQHPRAADAQLSIGSVHEKGDNLEQALAAYSRVLELYPNSTQAPTALYRAALIEVKRGNRTQARSMLNQITAAYPRSPEAPRAKEQLQKLR